MEGLGGETALNELKITCDMHIVHYEDYDVRASNLKRLRTSQVKPNLGVLPD